MAVIKKKLLFFEKLIETRVTLLYFYMPLIVFFGEGFSENTNKKFASNSMWLIRHHLCGSSVLLFSTKNEVFLGFLIRRLLSMPLSDKSNKS